jgi:hypothetical protein
MTEAEQTKKKPTPGGVVCRWRGEKTEEPVGKTRV